MASRLEGWFSSAILVALVLLASGWVAPAALANASRCSFDPSCLCITWFGEGGATVEIRCPGEGSGSGWTTTGVTPSEPPEIDDPEGSFEGTGQIASSGTAPGSEPSEEQDEALRAGIRVALEKLTNDPECKKLFANSPTRTEGASLLARAQWRDGESIPNSRCIEPDVAAFVRQTPNTAQLPAVYLCNSFGALNQGQSALMIIHELLHVAGQAENDSFTFGPGDPPNSWSINLAVSEACNLPLPY